LRFPTAHGKRPRDVGPFRDLALDQFAVSIKVNLSAGKRYNEWTIRAAQKDRAVTSNYSVDDWWTIAEETPIAANS
jgi:hypothetical protein